MTAAAFESTRVASECTRQVDVAAALAAYTGATLANAVRSAERRHRARVWQAAVPNGLVAPQEFAALSADATRPESYTRTDGTTFALMGWKYIVTVTATWGGGNVVLQDANSVARLTWTSDGTQTIELPYGTYSFAITTATGVTATVKNATYTDGVSSI